MAEWAKSGIAIPGGPHFLAELYSFDWSALKFRQPLISAVAVALCLFGGVLAGHPGAGLIAGGGGFTVGFGANQRIADSRLIPMAAALLATSAATLTGTVAGRRDYWLLLAAGASAIVCGILTTRHSGLAWVGQQAAIALLVASAFPKGPQPALTRAGLIAAGGLVQLLVTSAGLRLIPELRRDLLAMATKLVNTFRDEERRFGVSLRGLPVTLPAFTARQSMVYSLRLLMTILLATEAYRRIGIQSGYWTPITALLCRSRRSLRR